ncbi:MAG: alkaline phosphatase family protein [Acidiferrobacterales bacterium]|nr:alkaline phosphatase family protein [Acidiferrobacterales bacterium]
MQRHLALINVVGLTPSMIGENTPALSRLAKTGFIKPMQTVSPAVTTTAQSAMLTGKQANEHGIVGNGWYVKDLAEVAFWKQANTLVQSKKVWDALKQKHANFKVSKLFWWYNMYANVDNSMTPRPHYLADGGKIFDLYSSPTGLHQKIEEKIGKFPFFTFWGPKAGLESSEWIAKAAIEEYKTNQPNLQLVYLPHLDYNLQRLGPSHPDIQKDISKIDSVCENLINFYEENGVDILVVSEYGITDVNQPIHINRILRENNYIAVRKTAGFENLDCGASEAFAVADHQCAHIYIKNKDNVEKIKDLLQRIDGIEKVYTKDEQSQLNIDHERSGDLFAISEASAWFTYYYWLDDSAAPDFARTVDIHRKPGYDPVELFIDPSIKFPALKIAGKLIKKILGQRMLMDVIPLDANLVKGSHGRLNDNAADGPIIIGPKLLEKDHIHMTDLFDMIIDYFETEH